MDRIEWLILQTIIWTLLLLIAFSIFFLIKYNRSPDIARIYNFIGEKKKQINNKKDQKNYISRIYTRNSTARFTCFLSIFFLLIISFIVLNHYVNFVVITSDSMSPTLSKGDLVLVQSIAATPEVGDVIQFEVPSRKLPVMHRVYDISVNGYITKGDVSQIPDYWIVSDSQIQAKAVNIFGKLLIIPEIGKYFIIEPENTKFGSKISFISGLMNIFKIFSLIILILVFLSLCDTFVNS
jgi:signal peptidase I